MPKGEPIDVTAQVPEEFWVKNGLTQNTSVFGWGSLRIIKTVEQVGDDTWEHLSVSCRNRYPSWDELLAVRYEFFLNDHQVIQIFPPKDLYISLHKFAFHLWHCQTNDVLPLEVMGYSK